MLGHDGNSVLAAAVGHDGVRGLQVEVSNESGSPGLSGLLFFRGLEETLLPHPVVIEELAHVVSDRVGKNANNASTCTTNTVRPTRSRFEWMSVRTFREGLGNLQSSPDDGARRTTAQQTFFLDQTARHGEGLVVVTLDPLVAQAAVENGGNKVVADTFNGVAVNTFGVELFGLSQNGALRVDTNNLKTTPLLIHCSANNA